MITGWHKKVDMLNRFVFNFLLFGDKCMYRCTQLTLIMHTLPNDGSIFGVAAVVVVLLDMDL